MDFFLGIILVDFFTTSFYCWFYCCGDFSDLYIFLL